MNMLLAQNILLTVSFKSHRKLINPDYNTGLLMLIDGSLIEPTLCNY